MKRFLLTAGAVLFAWTAIAPPVSAGDEAVPPVQPSIPFPKILSPDKFDHPVLKRAYAAAARHREIVAQLPCYCWCNRMGHRNLLDCFASNHGANCDVCIKEVLLADEMVKKGKTAAQIRAAVIKKDYEKVQLK
ncbi:MAG: PCYCGC domain-containing protein [Bryobacterales bacterium]|nr:PCYCGC domain-containing protein [Bryobacterales bacterium]